MNSVGDVEECVDGVRSLLAATAWPVQAADRDKLLTDPGVYGTFRRISTGSDWGDHTRRWPVSLRCRKRRS